MKNNEVADFFLCFWNADDWQLKLIRHAQNNKRQKVKERKKRKEKKRKKERKEKNERKKRKVKKRKEKKRKERTRTAWAVFKYCGTKTVPLRMKKKLWKYWLKIYMKKTIKKGVRIRYK